MLHTLTNPLRTRRPSQDDLPDTALPPPESASAVNELPPKPTLSEKFRSPARKFSEEWYNGETRIVEDFGSIPEDEILRLARDLEASTRRQLAKNQTPQGEFEEEGGRGT